MNEISVDTKIAHLKNFQSELEAGSFDSTEDSQTFVQLKKLSIFLVECHFELRNSLSDRADMSAEGGYIRLSTKMEHGLMVYWLNHWDDNPPAWFDRWLAESEFHKIAFDILKFMVKEYKSFEMHEKEHACLMAKAKTPGLVGDDGTIFGLDKYEQLDPKWMVATLNFVLNLLHPSDIFHPFPAPELTPIKLSPKQANPDPVLGIIGDWGGGSYCETGKNGEVNSPAMRVIEDVKKQCIDYLIHLGDTYYAGTNGSRLGPDSANEEQDNLVSVWPDQGEGRNFTLNSNHEMYGAAQGIFDVAIQHSKLFCAQNGASVFALTYPIKSDDGANKSWLVLGLDSAYFSDKENGIKMYMEGAIGSKRLFDEYRAQMDLITKVCEGHEGPIMVMTHHNPCETITARTNILYDQVCEAIGAEPAVWLWGHVHNGIVYDRMSIKTNLYSGTKSRCCGHGAVPFGPAWGLEGDSNILYYAHTHDDEFPDDVPRVKNGYALVTLHDDGGFTEAFYEVGAPDTPAYQKRWAANSD
jgi:hypothetical protein